MATIIIGLLLAVLDFFACRSAIGKVRGGCCGGTCTADSKQKSTVDRHPDHYAYSVTLKIDGMHCANCRRRVEGALNALDGVYAEVDRNLRGAKVYMKKHVPEEELRRTVLKAGYSLRSMSA